MAGAANEIRREFRRIVTQARYLWRLLPLCRKVPLLAAASLMAVASVASTAVPLLLGRLLDGLKQGLDAGTSGSDLYRFALLYLGLISAAYVVREIVNVVRRYYVEDSCTRIERDLTCRLIGHLMRVDLTRLSAEKSGTLNGRLSRCVVGSVRFIRLAFLDFFPVLLSGSFALAAAMSKQPWLGLAMLGALPVSLFITLRQLASQKDVRLELIRSREEMDGIVVELLNGMDYIRAAHTHDAELQRLSAAIEERRGKEMRHHWEMSLFGSGKALNEGIFHVLILALSIFLAVQGTISFGDILTLSMLFLNVMAPMSEIHRVLDEGHECSLQVANLLEMLSEPEDRSFHVTEPLRPQPRLGDPILEAAELCVQYQTRDGEVRRVLDGIGVHIPHGETIGVAGPSGSGKTTWLRALMRLSHPDSGSLRVAGVPVNQLTRDAIAQLVGYVGQFPFLFGGTIVQNIAYGCGNVPQERIEWAARMANLHDDIVAMPRGYQTVLAERGSNLSGGQRQRVALARVFLKDPPILILDEATSALDTISERHVQEALAQTRRQRTIILVAHRLSTLVSTDRILVFDQGHIVESGSYDELVRRDGVFAALVRSSAKIPLGFSEVHVA
jgi:ATP-binding cassette subfamily B protein